MKHSHIYASLALFSPTVFFMACGGGELADKVKDLVELNTDNFITEADLGINTPAGWDFVLALELEADQASTLDGSFAIDLSQAEPLLEQAGMTLPTINNQVIVAKVVDLGAPYGERLRFSKKASMSDSEIAIDTSANLGTSGDLGAGTYVFYHSQNRVGFYKGNVTDCNGNPSDGELVVVSNTPFISYTTDGQWAVPSVTANPTNPSEGLPTSVFFEGENCSGSTTLPATEGDPNPKADVEAMDTAAPPVEEKPIETEEADDGTAVNDAGDTSLVTPEPVPEPEPTVTTIDFADGFGNCVFSSTSDDSYEYAAILSDNYANFFPSSGSTEGNYLFLSTGGSSREQATVHCPLSIPSTATSIEIRYNFISQEYSEWVGSGYNDIFSVKVDGAPDLIINRTINNAGSSELWESISAEGEAIGQIASSVDASYNETGKIFDGQLKPDARGAKITESTGTTAIADISEHAGTDIVLVMTVGDVGDYIFDTAALIDSIAVY